MQSSKNLRRAAIIMVVSLGTVVLASCTPEQMALARQIAAQRESIRMHPFLVCVRHHESDRDGPYPYIGGYFEKNPTSSASGGYQFIDGTWSVAANRSGHGSYANAPARYAPDWVQDDVAYDTAIRRGERYHWNGTGC